MKGKRMMSTDGYDPSNIGGAAARGRLVVGDSVVVSLAVPALGQAAGKRAPCRSVEGDGATYLVDQGGGA